MKPMNLHNVVPKRDGWKATFKEKRTYSKPLGQTSHSHMSQEKQKVYPP